MLHTHLRLRSFLFFFFTGTLLLSVCHPPFFLPCSHIPLIGFASCSFVSFCSICFHCPPFVSSNLLLYINPRPTLPTLCLPLCHVSLSCHRSVSHPPHTHCGLKACEISHRVRQHGFASKTYCRKLTRLWGIDFLSALWEENGSEVKAKSPAVDTNSHHNTGCSLIVGLVSLSRMEQ